VALELSGELIFVANNYKHEFIVVFLRSGDQVINV
jgi:hypothetical protein